MSKRQDIYYWTCDSEDQYAHLQFEQKLLVCQKKSRIHCYNVPSPVKADQHTKIQEYIFCVHYQVFFIVNFQNIPADEYESDDFEATDTLVSASEPEVVYAQFR